MEQGFGLRALVLGGDGVATGPPVTVSSSVVGEPMAEPGPGRKVSLWFIEDSDDGIRHLATTVHCGP